MVICHYLFLGLPEPGEGIYFKRKAKLTLGNIFAFLSSPNILSNLKYYSGVIRLRSTLRVHTKGAPR